MDAKHPSLAAAFAPASSPQGKDRAAALAGLLPPRKVPKVEDEQVDVLGSEIPAHGAESERAAEASKPKARLKSATRSEKVGAGQPALDGNAIVNLPVYLPDDLREQLAASRGKTYADWLFEAFEQVGSERLADYFSLKPRTTASGIPLAPEAENPGTGPQRQFRVRRAQLMWVEELAAKVGAPNRSVLCVAALRLYLAGRER